MSVGGGSETNIDTVNITKITSARYSSEKDTGDKDNGQGESRGTMTAAAQECHRPLQQAYTPIPHC